MRDQKPHEKVTEVNLSDQNITTATLVSVMTSTRKRLSVYGRWERHLAVYIFTSEKKEIVGMYLHYDK